MQEVAAATFVGRDAELAAVERFLERISAGPHALVIDGEAGIGKTTVWLEAVRSAEEKGLRVLKARPAESEADLSYAALSDLVGTAFDETRTVLPAVQERALASALLRGEPGADAAPRTTATALVGVLGLLADQEPALVAIDDVQWLDPATEQALTFAFRRLPARVGVLLARRAAPGGELPLGLMRALPDERVERMVPQPLSLGALHQLVSSRLGLSFPRPLLGQLAESSGGNPFFALELARAYAARPADPDVGEPLPVPRGIEDLVAAHVGSLSDAARQVALVAAAASYPTTSLLADALPDSDVSGALVEAEEAGVLVTERERVLFAHPLLASVIYGSASNERRRQLHKRLAVVVPDSEQRARHLALSTTEADESVASEVEGAAVQARRRGAQHAAAELFAASARLTPKDLQEELARRRLGEAAGLLASGDVRAARELAEELTATSPTPALRAEAHYVVSEILWVAGTFEGATQHLEEALAAAPKDQALAARAYPRLVYFNVAHHPSRALELADTAMDVLDPGRTPGALASVVISRMWTELMLGKPYRPELLQQWRELEERAGPEAPKSVLPLIHFHSIDDFEAARARHAVEDEWYRDRGEDDWRAERQAHRAYVEFRAGEWDFAEELVEDSCAMIAQVEQPGPWTMAFRFRAIVDAGRGRTERARETLLPLIGDAERSGRAGAHWEALLLSALAFVEFSAGDHEAVDRALGRMRERLDTIGTHEYVPDRSEPFHVESLVALGEVDRAREVLERLGARGRVFPRLWIDATLPRTRALMLAAEGDVQGALAALAELDLDRAATLPLDLGWTFLVQGRLCRRARQRRAAAEALQRALQIFERLGAPTWVEQTRAELERVGLRRAKQELTATERRVAELAASGLTNREVAAQAYMSPKTVEANLARVYRKLGIHSRAELGARIEGGRAGREASKPPAGTRELATILFTDLVGSTETTRTLGDAAWSALLDRHNGALRAELARFSGEEIDTAGDGFFAIFAAPARAIQCGLAIAEVTHGLGLEVRVGVHTGEVEHTADKPRGIAIVTCQRIMALAGPGEVLVSATTRDLVAGSALEFEDRGEHELKGIGGARRLFAAR
jgi:class 3 adenylate cyclase